jgi:hypothetical protein
MHPFDSAHADALEAVLVFPPELTDAMFNVTGPTAMVQDMRDMVRTIAVPKSRMGQFRQTFPLTHWPIDGRFDRSDTAGP